LPAFYCLFIKLTLAGIYINNNYTVPAFWVLDFEFVFILYCKNSDFDDRGTIKPVKNQKSGQPVTPDKIKHNDWRLIRMTTFTELLINQCKYNDT
jgi:hypothetical protein